MNCDLCGKPTKSHIIGRKAYCHTCFSNPENYDKIETVYVQERKSKVGQVTKLFEKMLGV